jgi:hypothetical protein
MPGGAGYAEMSLVPITAPPPSALSEQKPGILGRLSKRWSLGRAINVYYGVIGH